VRACSAEELQRVWPAYAGELFARTPFRAVMSLPLVLDANLRGALDVFFADQGSMDAVSMADASTVADRIVEALNASRVAGSSTGTEPTTDLPPWLANPKAERRLQVWIAMGMAMSRFHVTASDALALLRAHAYSRDTTLDDLADDLVNGVVALDDLTP
jgi:hypothetical protein